ncbi:hypothetical protein SAMN03159343_0422 [Klenkia marina]|uniref:Uncharacterized protein n=1 Tax=Klenkia marina TaxID=1960309 RepID=A0A1G4XBD8_9ACTN|nr:hypothetical protein [Klenkia marina]SCX38477.1 hypothetical protein SAMN03159343_0422 [Klenkia marina]
MSAPTTSSAASAASADPEVAAYARQVREALADVSAARLEELLEDLEEHLVEVASETPGPLDDRLGSPAAYAAELRRAAGLPEAPDGAPGDRTDGWRWDLARYRDRYADHGVVVAVREFLPELRPAWWVVRGWAVVAVLGYAVQGEVTMPLPSLGLGVVGWAITLAVVVWSVRVGLRTRAAGAGLTHGWAAVNLALAVCTVIAVVGVADRFSYAGYDPTTVSYDSGPTTLVHEDGTPITNIVPYGPDGEPLAGVLLYDQDGRPIDNLSTWDDDGTEVRPQQGVPVQPDNAYPQRQEVVTYDEYGTPQTAESPLPTTAAPSSSAPPVEPTPEPAPTEAPAP